MTERGDQLARLFDEHVWDVYGFIAYRVRSRDDAEDLTQLTFERAVRAWSRFDPSRSRPRTWLLVIARNLVIDHLRSDHSPTQSPIGDAGVREDALGTSPGPEAELGLSPELEAAIGRLSDRDREVIALRFGGELTGPEIADMLGLSLANVQQILSRSLRKLRAEMEVPR